MDTSATDNRARARTRPAARSGGKKKRKGKPSHSMAELADIHDLYQRSVQSPDHEVWFFNKIFKKEFGRDARVLREDFCGTAAVCAEWVKKKKKLDRIAYGVDLDPGPLAWAKENNLSQLKPELAERVSLVTKDACRVHGPAADIVACQNFSFQFFKTRRELVRYFRAARKNLADEGMLFIDMLGGSETIEEDRREEKKFRGFTYVWHQQKFNPIDHHCRFAIHFEFPDGSAIENAYVYDWRLWTIPEVRELLMEAGFSRVDVYWEGEDDAFRKREVAESDPCWICYLVAVK